MMSFIFPVVEAYFSNRKLPEAECNLAPVSLNRSQTCHHWKHEADRLFYNSINLGLLSDDLKRGICLYDECSYHPSAR